jgi:sugar diacid utilization regulator
VALPSAEDCEPARGVQADLSPDRLTLSRLLQERAVRSAQVIGGPAPDAVISWCLPFDQVTGSSDRLDEVAVYARTGQLETSQDLPAVLGELTKRGAAVAILAGQISETSSASLSELALPVVLVPASLTYRRLSRLVAELTLAREAHVLRYGLTVHRTLAELLHIGAGLTALCYQLSQLADCPVAILDPQRRLLAFEQSQGRGLSPLAVGRALRENAPDLIPEAVAPGVGPATGIVQFDGFCATCVVNPIVLGGRHDGWVVVIESADPPHPQDLAEHRIVVEQAAMIVGTEMLRMRSVEQAEERARGDFVHALLHGRFTTAHDLQARAAYYDIPVNGTYGVIVASGLGALVTSESVAAMFQLSREAARLLARPGRHTLATVVGDVLAVICELDPPDSRSPKPEESRALSECAKLLEPELVRSLSGPACVTYGRPVTGAGRILQSYRDARIALTLRQRLGIDSVCGFADLRVYATLADLAVSSPGKAFASDVLAPLRVGGTDAEDLERAVIAYIEAGGNVNATSRQLHIHRNTMLYKLDRASRALQLDLRQAEDRFTVWLAHKLAILADAAEKADRDLTPQ